MNSILKIKKDNKMFINGQSPELELCVIIVL